VGPPGQPEFANAAALLYWSGDPSALRERLRSLEAALGRSRGVDRYAPRTIDLDLVFHGTGVYETEGLRLPDPDLAHQAYLAVPAAEVAPAWVHPDTGETLQEIAARLLAGLAERERPRRLPLRLAP
jgi:2-amino-4-hydroxy-6-hydroxymethyldihydropteridine diphosphokinase